MTSQDILLRPGTVLGRYRLIRRLAIGGMAELFLARAEGSSGFEKGVVLKCILPQYQDDQEMMRMFLDEARLAGRLTHPNIVQVFDSGQQEGKHFFTMEYVHGRDLQTVLHHCRSRGEKLTLEQVVHITLAVASGLHYAHESKDNAGQPMGIVHRDVSASNVLVGYDGMVRVTDFGIAKAASRQTATRTGVIRGKAACMSPEQCRGETVDRRSDLFALGTLLYELTTLRRPFAGENDYAILNKIVNEDAIAPSQLDSNYPAQLEQIVLRALQKDVDDRYATAREIQVDLENFAREQQMVVSPLELARTMEEWFSPIPPYPDLRASSDESALAGQQTSEKAENEARPARHSARSRRWLLRGKRMAALLFFLLAIALFFSWALFSLTKTVPSSGGPLSQPALKERTVESIPAPPIVRSDPQRALQNTETTKDNTPQTAAEAPAESPRKSQTGRNQTNPKRALRKNLRSSASANVKTKRKPSAKARPSASQVEQPPDLDAPFPR